MLNYQNDRQELIKDLLNERKNLLDNQVNILLDNYSKKDEINHVIKAFGISDENIGTEYIIELITNTYLDIDNDVDSKTIREDLKDRNSISYKLLAYEYFGEMNEKSLSLINSEINYAFSKKVKARTTLCSSDLLNVFGGRKNVNLASFVYLIAKYMHTNKMLEKEKVFKL